VSKPVSKTASQNVSPLMGKVRQMEERERLRTTHHSTINRWVFLISLSGRLNLSANEALSLEKKRETML
jgi:hypothetical protein